MVSSTRIATMDFSFRTSGVNMSPLVTVAIPTRNRQVCAATLVRTVLDVLEDCEVVVSDNSDDDSLRGLLMDFANDERLVYKHHPGEMSVVQNFNDALSASTGEYVTMLGDDDTIGPEFLRYVEMAKEEGIDTLTYQSEGRVLHYFWPGVSSPRWGDIGGKLYFSRFTGRCHVLDTRRAIRDSILHLGNGPRRLPRIYLGVVSRELIEEVKRQYGELFGGVSPDVYSSCLLAMCCQNPVVVDHPLVIPGASPQSASAKRAERTDVGGLTANEYMSRFSNLSWDERIPRYYAPYTVWADSHLKAHKTIHKTVPLRSFAHLYAMCLLFTSSQARLFVPNAIRAHGKIGRRFQVALLTVFSVVAILVRYAYEKVPALITRRPGGARYEIAGVSDTNSARERLGEFIGNPRSP